MLVQKQQVELLLDNCVESGAKKRMRLLAGLSKEERIEIKQTMQLVYPNLALAQIKNQRTKTI